MEISLEIKIKHPYVRVGTISNYHDAKNNNALDIIEKSGSTGDIIGFSLYPQMLKNAKPDEVEDYFEEMAAIAKS